MGSLLSRSLSLVAVLTIGIAPVTARASAVDLGQAGAMELRGASVSAPELRVSIENPSVLSGGRLEFSWDIQGGGDPRVTGAEVCADVPNLHQGTKDRSCRFYDVSGGRDGAATIDISSLALKSQLSLSVIDGDVEIATAPSAFETPDFSGWSWFIVPSTGGESIGYFDRGTVKTGWFTWEKNWYFSDANGAREHDKWIRSGSAWYYLGVDGAMKTGRTELSDGTYYLSANGVMLTGWINSGGQWVYANASGRVQTGWNAIGGKWYFMDPSGVMQTGWTQVGSTWYFMNSSGVMQTGWLRQGSAWYFLNNAGAMRTGWNAIGGKWYFMDPSGVMQTGWTQVGSTWYSMNSSGVMQTGWVSSSGSWYYMNSSGVMQTGWVNTGGAWYYMSPEGPMVTGSYYVDGATNAFASNGRWLGVQGSAGSGGTAATYKNCTDVWNRLGRPIYRGEPGFESRFDADGDGVGCETRPR